jgi:catechol 2,3-dioxygenase-like lactoylglutathione lyase family enzyme
MPFIDHAGICPADIDEALRFYRDGIGLAVLFDVVLDADVGPLLGETTQRVRTVFLGNRDNPGAGAVELVDLGTTDRGAEPVPNGLPRRGLFLISFHVPVEETLARLAEMGLGGTPRKMPTIKGNWSATVVDPDGTVVELLDDLVSFGTQI